jgi:hypothetical protein
MSGCEWFATLSDIDAATTHALFSILDQVWPRWEVSDRRLWIPHATGFFFGQVCIRVSAEAVYYGYF